MFCLVGCWKFHRPVTRAARFRPQVLFKFLDACAHPVYVSPAFRSSRQIVTVHKCGIWRESHHASEPGEVRPHDHIAVHASKFMFGPVKRALLQRHRLASHWSCTHDGYWSCVRYVVVPSPKKPLASLDMLPLVWPASHPPLRECCHKPWTAAATLARRVAAENAAAETSATDVIGGLDSDCVIPGNGQFSQPVISKHAVGSDSVFPDQSDAETDVIIDKCVDGAGTCMGLQAENPDTDLEAERKRLRRRPRRRSNRGLPLSEKKWLRDAAQSLRGKRLHYFEVRAIITRGIALKKLSADIGFEQARHVIRHALQV